MSKEVADEFVDFARKLSAELKQERPSLALQERMKMIGGQWKERSSRRSGPREEAAFEGTKTLYHATTNEKARRIAEEGEIRAAEAGMFGAAIYFRETLASAKRSGREEDLVIYRTRVNLGRCVVLSGSHPNLTLSQLQKWGYNSVKGCRGTDGELEYAVFEAERIETFSVVWERRGCRVNEHRPRRDPFHSLSYRD